MARGRQRDLTCCVHCRRAVESLDRCPRCFAPTAWLTFGEYLRQLASSEALLAVRERPGMTFPELVSEMRIRSQGAVSQPKQVRCPILCTLVQSGKVKARLVDGRLTYWSRCLRIL